MIVDMSLLFEVFFGDVDNSDEPTTLFLCPPFCFFAVGFFLLMNLGFPPATCQSVQLTWVSMIKKMWKGGFLEHYYPASLGFGSFQF
jgi:hypothetical protein